jgi:nucleotide-binding universal stress UspA family protein
MFAPKQILVPTDFSTFSDKALKEAIDVAKQHGSTIHLLHVISIVQQCAVDYCMTGEVMNELEKQSAETAQNKIKEEIDKLPESKTVTIIPEVKKGTPYEEILKHQTEKNIDLIVIASHGTTGLLHHFMGGVAEKVSKGARCPVLLLRS